MNQHVYMDQKFLNELFTSNTRTTYIKIISLNFEDLPFDSMEGVVTSGSINLDGKSSVRRSCSLTLSVDKNSYILNQSSWSLSTKIKVFFGVKNTVCDFNDYGEIIWFPQGEFYISQFNYSTSLTSYTVSLSCKDKMCMLNGELGGVFTSLTIDLGQVNDYNENGEIVATKDLKLYDIIRELVHHYGREPYHNIIINDLDMSGSEILEYRGNEPLYLLKDSANNITTCISDPEYKIGIKYTNGTYGIVQINNSDLVYETIGQIDEFAVQPTSVYMVVQDIETLAFNVLTEDKYSIIKLEYGQIAGYRPTELTFAGKFIMNQGETVTSALDKIINMLGPYEYFYNTDGQFIFQKKPVAFETSFNNLREDSGTGLKYIEPLAYTQKQAHVFDNYKVISQYQDNLNINNIKNDYVVWGRQNDRNIMMHYSIKSKPTYYKAYNGVEYATAEKYYPLSSEQEKNIYDWREIMYQMAFDNHKNGNKSDFYIKLNQNNPSLMQGTTGYEYYYQELLAYWRDLYNPTPPPEYKRISYAEPLDKYPQRFVDKIEPITLTELEKLKTVANLYTIRNNELQKWSNAIDLTQLQGTGHSYPIDNIYYSTRNIPTKIINNIDYRITPLYKKSQNILGEDIYQPIYQFLSNDLAETIYISNDQYSEKIKYQDYYSITSYQTSNLQYPFAYNQLFLKRINSETGENEYVQIYEISLLLPTENTPVLWQYYKNVSLDHNTLQILATAINNYDTNVKLYVHGSEEVLSFHPDEGEDICIKAFLNADNKVLWYQKADGTYDYLSSLILKDGETTEKNTFNKYELYVYKDQIGYVNTIDAIDVDKTNLLWGVINDDDKLSFESLLIQDFMRPKSINNIYIKAEDKIEVQSISDGLKDFYINSTDASFKQFLNYTYLNIKGEPHVLHEDAIGTSLIKYYHRYYNYFLATGADFTKCWNIAIYNNFSLAHFWIDFLDIQGSLSKFAVDKINYRTKTENNQSVTGINFGDLPWFQWIEEKDWDVVDRTEGSYTYIRMPVGLEQYFVVSSKGTSCKNVIDNWLNSYACISNTISFSCIPNYALQPNDIIVLDAKKYEITKITLPLSYDGQMNISATLLQTNVF